jgi:hypothetical protein
MRTTLQIIRLSVITLLALIAFAALTLAQEVQIPDPALNAAIHEALGKPAGPLTQSDLLGLTGLSAIFRNITNVQGLEAAQNLVSLDLQDNRITSVNILTNLTRLVFLDLSENRFPQLTLPGGMTNLTTLRVEFGGLTNITLPAGLTELTNLRLGFNQLPSLALPADMTNLSFLSVFQNQLTNLALPPMLTSLTNLNLDGNRLSNLNLPAGMTKLDTLIAGANQLTSFTVPADMTNLTFLRLNDNQLTNLTLPAGLNHLSFLFLPGNQLSSLTLPTGLTNLNGLVLQSNRLTNLTLPPDLTKLGTLLLDGNPLTTFVLSEPLAATNLAGTVMSLRNQGVSVFTYPLAVSLVSPSRTMNGAFELTLTGPPGLYPVLLPAEVLPRDGAKPAPEHGNHSAQYFHDGHRAVTGLISPKVINIHIYHEHHQTLHPTACADPACRGQLCDDNPGAGGVHPRSRPERRHPRGAAKTFRAIDRAGPAQPDEPGRQPSQREKHRWAGSGS